MAGMWTGWATQRAGECLHHYSLERGFEFVWLGIDQVYSLARFGLVYCLHVLRIFWELYLVHFHCHLDMI